MTGPYSKRGYDGENGPFVKADVETVLAKAEAGSTSGRERYGSPGRGVYETISAPIGEPAVFYREDTAEGIRFREEVRRRGLL